MRRLWPRRRVNPPPARELTLEEVDGHPDAAELRVTSSQDGALTFTIVDRRGREVDRTSLDEGEDLVVPLPFVNYAFGKGAYPDAEQVLTGVAVNRASRALLTSTLSDAQTTARRLSTSFNGYVWMLRLTFVIGLVAFVAAIVQGFTAPAGDAVALGVTAIFGGLSAASFVTTFIARPTGAMADAGPRAAWVQSIVTTYWSKLAYMSDPGTVLVELEDAQTRLAEAMKEYVAVTDAQRRRATRARSSATSRRTSGTTQQGGAAGTARPGAPGEPADGPKGLADGSTDSDDLAA